MSQAAPFCFIRCGVFIYTFNKRGNMNFDREEVTVEQVVELIKQQSLLYFKLSGKVFCINTQEAIIPDNVPHLSAIYMQLEYAAGYTLSNKLLQAAIRCKDLPFFYDTLMYVIEHTVDPNTFPLDRYIFPPKNTIESADALQTWLEFLSKCSEHNGTRTCTLIEYGSIEDFNNVVHSLVKSKQKLSDIEYEAVKFCVMNYGTVKMKEVFPKNIKNKEIAAMVDGELLRRGYVPLYANTCVDLLRAVAYIHNGDLSLNKNCLFMSMPRKLRRAVLRQLEILLKKRSLSNMLCESVKYRHKWIRLGESLHPGEYKNEFPLSYKFFTEFRQNTKIESKNTRVEEALKTHDIQAALRFLIKNPEELAKRLKHLLKQCKNYKSEASVVQCFSEVADAVSNDRLMIVRDFFSSCKNKLETPCEGAVAVAQAASFISSDIIDDVLSICDRVFAVRSELGKCEA